ncbi:MAG: hypothetical protein AB7P09_15155 [Pyrinomonadaceae bacterium]
MEILNSGSFVPLDNREKIDQLIYTARELATEVSRAEGFQNSGQTNHQLGLEMWKGAEYVCRAHEEANIRNLFLSKFLERLREIEKERAVQAKTTPNVHAAAPVQPEPIRQPLPAPVSVQPPQPPALQTVPEPPSQTETQDEYLGVIPADDRVDDQAENKRSSYADECVPEYDADIDAIVERLENEHPDPDADGSSGQLGMEPAQPAITETADAPVKETGTDHPITIEPSASSDVAANEGQPDVAESVESESIESVVLAEKEPYNLDACTVTAVIQMLPENSGSRKCIVSMRTHDFAPMVAVSEVGGGEIIPHISAALSDALEQYRIDLPAKAAEKLKKEKPAARKQVKSGSKSTKATTVQSKVATNSETTAAAPAPNPETDQSQRGLFAS